MPGDGETDGQTPEEETPPPANDGLEPLSDTHANHGADGTAADPITEWEEWDGDSGSFGGGGDRYLYLTKDTTGSITVQGNSRVYLCLNGYTLNGSITVGQSNLGGHPDHLRLLGVAYRQNHRFQQRYNQGERARHPEPVRRHPEL